MFKGLGLTGTAQHIEPFSKTLQDIRKNSAGLYILVLIPLHVGSNTFVQCPPLTPPCPVAHEVAIRSPLCP